MNLLARAHASMTRVPLGNCIHVPSIWTLIIGISGAAGGFIGRKPGRSDERIWKPGNQEGKRGRIWKPGDQEGKRRRSKRPDQERQRGTVLSSGDGEHGVDSL